MIVEWDIIAFNGIIHAIAEPLRIPAPTVHLGQVSVPRAPAGEEGAEAAGAGSGSGDEATESPHGPAASSAPSRRGALGLGCPQPRRGRCPSGAAPSPRR